MTSSPAASSIRNVAFIGINHSGKTSLVEAILHLTGAHNRRGKIADGTCTTDYEPESISRQMSLSTSMARCSYNGITFNLIDCPGFVDFVEETKLALSGVDVAVLVVDPDPHRIIQLDSLLRYTEDLGVARLVFVNKLDKHDVLYTETLAALKELRGKKTAHPVNPIHYPILTPNGITGYVDVLHHEAYKYGAQGKPERIDVPAELVETLEKTRDKMIDGLADTDEKLFELVMDGQDIPNERLAEDLKMASKNGVFVPILVGSAQSDAGVISLLDEIIELAPSPEEREYKDTSGKPIVVSKDGPVIAQVFKTYVHPQSGKLSLARVVSGTLTADSSLSVSTRQEHKERVGGLYWLQGKKQESMPVAGPGSIVAIARLEKARTGDTLVSDEKDTRVLPRPEPPPPLYSLAIAPKTHADEAKLSTLLSKLIEEDPLLIAARDPDTGEYCLFGQGEMHLTVSRQRLERKYHVQVETHRPKIAYKETIRTPVEAHGRHKKQSGGRGQFGDVHLRLEPSERGAGNKFSESVVGGSVPRQYIPGVEKGVIEALQRGPLSRFPVVDVSVNLFDGSYHDVDSDEMSFRTAAILGMREGLSKANPLILEPLAEVKVFVPQSFTAGVVSQLNGLRGHILATGPTDDHPGWDEVSAQVPQSELWDYVIELRTLSQGLGYYTWRFSHLAPVPADVSHKLQSEATAAAADEGHHH